MDKKNRLVGNDILPKGSQDFIGPREPIPKLAVNKAHATSQENIKVSQPRVLDIPKVAQKSTVISNKKRKNRTYQGNLNTLAYDLIIIVILGFISLDNALINWAFLLYAILIIVRRVPSQRVFTSALICLILIPILTIFGRSSLANTFAIFTFFFLVIGTVVMGIEMRKNEL